MQSTRLRLVLRIGLAFVAFDLAVVGVIAVVSGCGDKESSNGVNSSTSGVHFIEATPVKVIESSEFTARRLGGGLDRVVVYDILADSNGTDAWLGTGLGLVLLRPDGFTQTYRALPGSPREWARNLVWIDDSIALTVTTAQGNTGGKLVGTYLFHLSDQRFEKIGPYARALAWDGSQLVGLMGRSAVRFLRSNGDWMTEEIAPAIEVCSSADMARAGDSLWLSQQDSRRSAGSVQEIPCGVTRFRVDGDATQWLQEDGLVSGLGRAIVGDEAAVFVAHGIQGEGLSVFEHAAGIWRRVRSSANGVYLGANVLGISPSAVWLGTPDGGQPLKRFDRKSSNARVIEGIPEDHFVSAIAGGAGGAWVAWSHKEWEEGSYEVTTWLAWVRDERAQ